MQHDLNCDIAVCGAGPAGLIATAALAASGRRVLCVDPTPPVTAEDDDGADLRTTAILRPAAALLERAGLWAALAPHATPLQVMRIVDAGGARATPRLTRDFDAAELGPAPFGWNLPNWLIRRVLTERLAALPGATLVTGAGGAGMTPRTDDALLRLTDGRRVRTRLVIAADGRDSPMRQALGIGARTWRYGQTALAFAVTHDAPHGNVSTEVHRDGGPFTLVPLPDRDGRPASAVVWMDRDAAIARLQGLDTPAFEAAMTERSAGVLGPLRRASRLAAWPIVSRLADRFAAPRAVLVAEAAHAVPPIGAQGLNMSLADIAALLDGMGTDPGDPARLAAWARARRADALVRVLGIDALNRASMAAPRPLRDLRAAGLAALHVARPVRRALMRTGLGAR